MYNLIYKSKKIQSISPEQAQILMQEFYAEKDVIFFNGQTFKTRNLEIINEQEEENLTGDPFVLHKGKKIPRSEYMKIWNEEQTRLKCLTPNQKATLNFEKKFVWEYLLQVGATRVLGADWQKKSKREIIDEVEGKLLMANPEKFEKLMSAIREYFEKNKALIWCDDLLKEFLPRGNYQPEIVKQSVNRYKII